MTQNRQPKSIDAADLPLSVDAAAATAAYVQLANQLQALIESRALPSGVKLPATRALARALAINRNTVVASFERLASLGWIEAYGRGGTVVSNLSRQIAATSRDRTGNRAARIAGGSGRAEPVGPGVVASFRGAKPSSRRVSTSSPASPPRFDFRLGSADPSPLPIEVWRRACREAGRQLPGAGYGDPTGEIELRTQVALYLGRTRAMRVDPAQVMITAGAGQAIERLAEVILRPKDRAAVEEPGYPRAVRALRRFGASLMAVPVDADGIDTSVLFAQKKTPKVIHLTPSHQYPTGARLSPARRHALIQWAANHDVVIIENDYDGEFRYGTAPLPALGALAGFDHIAYVGTFSKVLSPAIRLGFVVARPNLIGAMSAVVAQTRDAVSVVTQRIVTWLIRSGELERHIRRTRRSYASRRSTMLEALARIPQVEAVIGHAAGLHVVVQVRARTATRNLPTRLQRAGVLVDRVADFQSGAGTDSRLLLAYGHLTEAEIVTGLQVLGAALG